MKRLLAMALLVLALVWFDAAFMEHGALVWPLPQPKGGVHALAWVNNTDCLLVAQNQVEPDEQRRNQYTYDFYLQSDNQPPRLVGSLPAGVFLRWLQVLPLSDGLMLDLHWRDELWFYDERSQTLQRQPDADRPQPEEGEYMNAFWLAHGLYLLSGDLAGGGAMAAAFTTAALGRSSRWRSCNLSGKLLCLRRALIWGRRLGAAVGWH